MSDYTSGNSIHVNFSDEEAGSEARSFDPLPRGKYPVKITDIELRFVKQGKNEGRPYWNVEFTVQEGDYDGRKVWTNVMLFDGALYSLAQLLKATGNEAALRTGQIPDPDELISNDVIINVIKKAATDEYDARNEVKGILRPDSLQGAGSGGSLLP